MPRKNKDQEKKVLKEIKEINEKNGTQNKIRIIASLIDDFIQNDQWKKYDERSGQVFDIQVPRDTRKAKERITDNFIYPLWKTAKALLLRSMPTVTAKPQNREDVEDAFGAEVAEILIDWADKVLLPRKSRLDMASILLDHGNVAFHTYAVERDGEKTIENRFLPPTQLFPFPHTAESWDQVLGMNWQRIVSPEVMERLYSKDGYGSKVEFTEEPTPEHLKPIGQRNLDVDGEAKGCVVNDYYRKPFGNDRGCYVRTWQDRILETKWIDSYIFNHKQLPFVNVRENHTGRGLFGWPALKLITGNQTDYNKAQSLMAEFRKAIPKLLIKYDSKINPKDVYDITQSIIEYLGEGGKPEYISPSHPSTALFEAIQNIPQRAEHTYGLHHSILRAESIGSVQSGVAIEALQDQDLWRIFPLLEELAGSYEEEYFQVYELMKQFFSKKKLVAILGDMGELYVKAVKLIRLKPMNFYIEAESMIPRNRAVDKDNAIQAAQYKAIDFSDRHQHREFLKIVLPSVAARSFLPDLKQERYARWENKQLLEEEEVVPNEWDNVKIHIEVLEDLLLHPYFKKLSDTIKRNTLAHYKVHKKQEREKVAQAMAMAQMARGETQGQGQGQPQIPAGQEAV